MEKSWLTWLLVAALAVSVFFNFSGAPSSNQSQEYPLLAKRIFGSSPNDILINFTELRDSLRNYVTKQGERMGIYFEYLPTGVNIGVNDRFEFYRTDLVQLPVVMRAYKLIEQEELATDTLLSEDGTPTNMTVGQAIDLIVTNSDKRAFFLLADEINGDTPINPGTSEGNEATISELYNYLDLPLAAEGETQFISPKSFSSILKSLYFSAYLAYESSSEILDKLTRSSFNDWLPYPASGAAMVAHKYGYFESGTVADVQVYSDCGIFYLPNRPYLLCVMVNSGDREKSVRHIRSISEMVYNYIRP